MVYLQFPTPRIKADLGHTQGVIFLDLVSVINGLSYNAHPDNHHIGQPQIRTDHIQRF